MKINARFAVMAASVAVLMAAAPTAQAVTSPGDIHPLVQAAHSPDGIPGNGVGPEFHTSSMARSYSEKHLGVAPRGSALVHVALIDDAELARPALRAGADAILFEDEPPERMSAQLAAAVRRALERRQIDPWLEVAVANLGESVELADHEARLRYVNPAFERLTGFSREEVIGKTPGELVRTTDHSPAYYASIEETVREGRVWRGPLTSRRKDGSRIHQEVTVSPVCDAHGKLRAMVAIRREVTRERKLEAQVRASERMASLGTLAAGVAHEINNPLAYVLANVEHVLEMLENGGPFDADELVEALRSAHAGGQRVRRIVSDLSSLARQQSDTVQSVQLTTVLDAAASVARGTLRKVAAFERTYEGQPTVLVDEGRLGQVALNLLVNAAQAIPAEDGDASHTITLRAGRDGDRAWFEVRDTGVGMTEDVRARCFDPFFTTKPPGEGTGLGMSMVHQIVTGYGGTLDIESAPGEGTTVRVWLPALEGTVGDAPEPAPVDAEAPATRPLRILVVDDEPSVCAALRRILRAHEVTVAYGGREGLLAATQESLDLVICDLMMPDMSGTQLREALPPSSPLLDRWIFITGGVLADRDRRHLRSFEGPLLSKPFSAAEVRRAIASVIED